MKSKEWMLHHNLPLLMVGLICIVLVVVIWSFQLPETERRIVVGCVLVGARDDKGWNESHSIGLSNACQTYDCGFMAWEWVAESEPTVSAAVRELVNDGANVIFLTSFGYGEYMDEIARKYPHVAFFGISGEGAAKNSTTYFARLYQARYIAGIIAGAESKTGILGYVTSTPNPQVNRSINAYAMGMRVANPKARLIVRFTGSWENKAAELESVILLAEKGADVITYHEDRPYAVQEAERLGLMSIGYDAVYEKYSDRFLTAALYNWKVLYEKVLGDYMSGRSNFSNSYWLGFDEGAVDLYPLSPRVSEKTAYLASVEKQRILENRSVFSGVIYDNKGNLRCDKDERISDHELFTGMDWFIEGVEIYE
ncbi:MAG: BMP family ABC transporter substrate-binding protein [Synergistaceae bacterium]|nr:BMP family ABC transporter substrate-binding protein [Synergistaceae bacterium]MBQ3347700.1 BMP family ABC transporter substrate-binding protein [Synergistaceae bacterium]MBQ3397489.1 BMP family ABC transporter substrate-binding protein [Synergistaceae bacterium]MBQ3757923.1 BMP family ABC transporter substrate-binding protein [Synergistaceae bacterium]MBQ4401554.1 BMP family ABC transporter substrate-binding protein [Synergistaceae bacterium]